MDEDIVDITNQVIKNVELDDKINEIFENIKNLGFKNIILSVSNDTRVEVRVDGDTKDLVTTSENILNFCKKKHDAKLKLLKYINGD